MTQNIRVWFHWLLAILPLVTAVATTAMWVDTRYMHKEISDTRYIDLQIKIIQAQIRNYEQRKDSNQPMSTMDHTSYTLDMQQLNQLLIERNRLLGIGQ